MIKGNNILKTTFLKKFELVAIQSGPSILIFLGLDFSKIVMQSSLLDANFGKELFYLTYKWKYGEIYTLCFSLVSSHNLLSTSPYMV